MAVLCLVVWLVLRNVNLAGLFESMPDVPDNVPPAAAVAAPPYADLVGKDGAGAAGVDSLNINSDALTQWAGSLAGKVDISVRALAAYGAAEALATQRWPDCHVRWNTIAGIGAVESRHGTYTGRLNSPSTIGADGRVSPVIIGPRLDGAPGFAEITDTDGGALDGDAEFDRAVGPMQFIPSTWATVGTDGDGDGVADPQNIFDAAASTATYLCFGGRDVATAEGWTSAVLAYNQSMDYLHKVRDAAALYAMEAPAEGATP